jgi:hypothetical protein
MTLSPPKWLKWIVASRKVIEIQGLELVSPPSCLLICGEKGKNKLPYCGMYSTIRNSIAN